LHSYDFTGRSSVSFWQYRPGLDLTAKRRRAIDRGTDRLSDHPGERESRVRGINERFSLEEVANVHKNYQLLPPGQYETNAAALNQLISGQRSISLDRGNYRIEVEANKVRFDYIRHHDDGKQICYGYIAEFDGQTPYPKLIITYVIPKAELYRSEVTNLRANKLLLEGNRDACQLAIGTLQGRVAESQQNLEECQQRLAEKIESLAAQKKAAQEEKVRGILARLEDQVTQNQVEQKRLESEIVNFTAITETLTKDIAEVRKHLEGLVFQRKRWALFIRTHAPHLENAVKMAQFFVSLKPKLSGIDAIDEKESRIVKECQKFLDYYQTQKDHLEQELNALGLILREKLIGVSGIADPFQSGKGVLDSISVSTHLIDALPRHLQSPAESSRSDNQNSNGQGLSIGAPNTTTTAESQSIDFPGVLDALHDSHWPQSNTIDRILAQNVQHVEEAISRDRNLESAQLPSNAGFLAYKKLI